MQDRIAVHLSIVYEADSGIRAKSISESKITDILNKSRLEMADVSVDVVKENMLKTLNGVAEVFDNKGLEDIAADDLKQIFHSWEEELEADLCGAALTLRVMGERGCDPYMSMLGIIVCTIPLSCLKRSKCCGLEIWKREEFPGATPQGCCGKSLWRGRFLRTGKRCFLKR